MKKFLIVLVIFLAICFVFFRPVFVLAVFSIPIVWLGYILLEKIRGVAGKPVVVKEWLKIIGLLVIIFFLVNLLIGAGQTVFAK